MDMDMNARSQADREPSAHPRLHGEYKVPGGKLVVADLTIRDGRLSEVMVTGDFFLEPPEALEIISHAAEHLPASADEETIAQAIDDALDPAVEMVGFSPAAVARAIRRAIDTHART